MTTGNTSKTTYSTIANIFYFPRFGAPSFQGTAPVEGRKIRVWSGDDRAVVVPVRPRPQGAKRTYTIPVEVKTRRGKPKTILVTKSFRERSIPSRVERELRNAPHAYSGYHMESNDVLTRWTWPAAPGDNVAGDMTVARVSGWPAWGSEENPLPTLDANDQIKLVLKLKEKIQGSDFNLAVFLAEGSQTMAMIASTAVRLAQAYRLSRKGRFDKAAKVLTGSRKNAKLQKPVANNWLELQYGWLPLLGDVKAGAEQLAHILNAPKTKRYHARIRKRRDYVTPFYGWNWSTAYASVSRDLTAYLTVPASTLASTGILDPELVAWELLPFSFVADWALPIGDFLEARAFSRHMTGTFVTSDLAITECKGILSQRFGPSDPKGHSVQSNSASMKTVRLTRSISTTLSVPKPVVKPINEILSWKHMANGLALLVQTFKNPDLPGLDLKISKHQRKSNNMWNDIVDKSRNSF